jgi:hypothetical protein
MALRKQWEYSHATSAALNLLALAALISSALCKGRFGDEEFSMKGVDHAKPR